MAKWPLNTGCTKYRSEHGENVILHYVVNSLCIKANVAATKNSSREKIQGNVWKVQNTTGRFPSRLHPSNFFLKILFVVPKVSNSWIFQRRCFMKIIWHRISIQTLLFQACYFLEAMFYENYLTSDFHTNTVISSLFAYPSKWRRKPW